MFAVHIGGSLLLIRVFFRWGFGRPNPFAVVPLIPADADRTGRRQVFRVRLDDQFATVHFLIAKPDNRCVAAKMLVQHSQENGVAIAKYLLARSEKAEAVPADIVR